MIWPDKEEMKKMERNPLKSHELRSCLSFLFLYQELGVKGPLHTKKMFLVRIAWREVRFTLTIYLTESLDCQRKKEKKRSLFWPQNWPFLFARKLNYVYKIYNCSQHFLLHKQRANFLDEGNDTMRNFQVRNKNKLHEIIIRTVQI